MYSLLIKSTSLLGDKADKVYKVEKSNRFNLIILTYLIFFLSLHEFDLCYTKYHQLCCYSKPPKF